MKITGLGQITVDQRPLDVRKWFRSWVDEVRRATWRRAVDVTTQFPKVRQTGESQFHFLSPDPTFVVVVAVAFQQGVVLIMRDVSSGAPNGT